MAKFTIITNDRPNPKRKFDLAPHLKAVKEFKFTNTSSAITSWSRPALSDRIIAIPLFLGLIVIVLPTIFTIFYFKNLPYQIPLFYSRTWGEAQLAKTIYIFLPLAGATLLGIFNFALAISLYNKEKILSYFLSGTAMLVAVLAAITVFNIVNLMR